MISRFCYSTSCIIDSSIYIRYLVLGPGLLSVEIFRKIPQATIIGIDPSIKFLQLAKENVVHTDFQTFELVVESLRIFLWKKSTADVIVSRFSLPYWTQPSKSFEEMIRVLKPGSKVILKHWNRDFPTWKLLFIKIRMLLNRVGQMSLNIISMHTNWHISMEQVEQLFTDAGFRIIEKEGEKNEWRFIIVAEKKINLHSTHRFICLWYHYNFWHNKNSNLHENRIETIPYIKKSWNIIAKVSLFLGYL